MDRQAMAVLPLRPAFGGAPNWEPKILQELPAAAPHPRDVR